MQLWAALLFLTHVKGDLQQLKWPTTVFAPPSLATSAIVSNLNSTAVCDPTSYCSVRFTGTLVSDSTQLVNFSLLTDGGVNMWVDDFLLIDEGEDISSGTRSLRSQLGLPMVAGKALPFRLDYLHYPGSSSVLQLSWVGNNTQLAIVPGSALGSASSPHELERVALKDRLINPSILWQTYDNPVSPVTIFLFF